MILNAYGKMPENRTRGMWTITEKVRTSLKIYVKKQSVCMNRYILL